MELQRPSSPTQSPQSLSWGWSASCLLLCALLAAAVFAGRQLRARSLPSAQAAAGQHTTTVSRGEIVFQIHCAKCHGPDGRGDGEGAAKLKPPPRDFAVRPWRFEPTKDKIREVTLHGIAGTAMPSAKGAIEGVDLEAVVDHVFLLATRQPPIVQQVTPEAHLLQTAGFYPANGQQPAPQLEVVDAAGVKRTLSEQKGKLVLLNFWGTNCEHCLKKLPQLNQLDEEFRKQGLVVWNVCADVESAAEAQELVGRVAPGVQTSVDESGLANGRFEVQALPTVWLIDSTGNVIGRSQGVQDWTRPEMKAVIKHYLP
ncbi:Thiol-disulfide oxidoreductase ResA [Anatilimnocola aggregata]|uniref:Thiol-disulfide oxidoreductase ResA n=1 Tax=Anatilimnocola aggregata TaxID=2528021 RepID=A0A517YIQ1_9BACT|nr:redoxin domain-containing protein [Anatilimnocola aggregata]QDU30113.1 Thiol-disulfide oxidoreductase ResA [Anatilimnocola aggregata]